MALQITHAPHIADLARELGRQIRQDLGDKSRSLFDPITIVVPNDTMAAWLKLRLAQDLGIAAGLEFSMLEQMLWRLLDDIQEPPQYRSRLDTAQMQRLILSLLMARAEDKAPELAPVWKYIGAPGTPAWEHGGQRRAWQLSEQLGRLFREYEVQRAEMIAAWQAGQLWNNDQSGVDPLTERWQQSLYFELFKPGGWRDQTLPHHLTLPQRSAKSSLHSSSASVTWKSRATPNLAVYGFGIGHMSPFHMDLLCELGQVCELRLLIPAPLWEDAGKAHELVKLWGVPSLQTHAMATAREEEAQIEVHGVPSETASICNPQILPTLQRQILHGAPMERQAQDSSIQVWACPGEHREVETVFNLILESLKQDPTLRLGDIAIIATDVNRYLPYLQEVFSRHERAIPYNVIDANAGQTSLFSTAASGLLNLIGSSFSRRDVFVLLNNPCFLEAVGADREMPRQWLAWASELGIFHSYDGASKRQYCDDSALTDEPEGADGAWGDAHTWLAGLRRLRLGRIMAASSELPQDQRDYAWQGHIPYDDMETGSASLDRFSFAVEMLFQQCTLAARVPEGDAPATEQPRRAPSEWSATLRTMIDACLTIPDDSPAETSVRASLYSSLSALASLDRCFSHGVTLDFARSHLLASLEEIPASYGRPLLNGVTISSPRQLRLLPFRDIYFLGLGEGRFPGEASRSTLDLRLERSHEGDISVPQINRQIFLDTLLAARDRLVLTYSNRDLEKDAEIGPCSLISQVQSYLEQNVLADGDLFVEAAAPLHGRSLKYLAAQNPAPGATLSNYDSHDHALALVAAGNAVPATFKVELDGAASAQQVAVVAEPLALTCRALKDFLVNPAEALLKRRMRLADDAIDGAAELEDEPFATEFPHNLRLTTGVQERYVRIATREGAVPDADLPGFFEQFYDDAHGRSLTPDGVFKGLDKDDRQRAFLKSIRGDGDASGLSSLLQTLPGAECCSVSLGHSKPGHGAVVFPELCLGSGTASTCVSGHLPFVWPLKDAIHCLVLTDSKQPENLGWKGGRWQLIKHILEPLLFFSALQAGEGARWVGGRRIVLHVGSKSGIKRADFQIPAAEAARYWKRLVAAYHGMSTFEDIPMSVVMEKSSLWPLSADNDHADYAAKLRLEVEEALSNPYKSDPSRMELLALIDGLQVPGDARAKIAERLMPLYNWRVPQEAK